MHARIIIGKIVMDKRDKAITIYQESIAPASRTQPGFKTGHLLSDPDTGKFIAISFWDSEKAMMVSEKSDYFQDQLNKISSYFAGPPIIQHYEVAASS